MKVIELANSRSRLRCDRTLSLALTNCFLSCSFNCIGMLPCMPPRGIQVFQYPPTIKKSWVKCWTFLCYTGRRKWRQKLQLLWLEPHNTNCFFFGSHDCVHWVNLAIHNDGVLQNSAGSVSVLGLPEVQGADKVLLHGSALMKLSKKISLGDVCLKFWQFW